MVSLFQTGHFKLHSGQESDFKIECDALTDEDLDTLALILSKRLKFRKVLGVVRGGIRFADALRKYEINDDSLPVLIADDVLTTGSSMLNMQKKIDAPTIGVVIFARSLCPDWIMPIFYMAINDL